MRPSPLRMKALLVALSCLAAPAGAATLVDSVSEALDAVAARAPSGVLLDRALPLSRIEAFDGSADAPRISASLWRQIHADLERAGAEAAGRTPVEELRDEARRAAARGEIRIGILDTAYDRLRAEALESGAITVDGGHVSVRRGTADTDLFAAGRVFAAAALRDVTYQGGELTFTLPADGYAGDRELSRVEVDFADGRGFREIARGARVPVSYATRGEKTLTLRAERTDGTHAEARFRFDVKRVFAPAPDDTLSITATVPHLGQFGTGEAYIYRSASNPVLTNPVIVVEGFDLDNSLNWPEIYDLLNQQNLVEDLRAEGFDAVVVNFTEATDPIQENAYVVAEVIQQINAMVGPGTSNVVIGASMGGLCSRYALLYLEQQGIDHRTRTYISFDSPHGGANIPLGVQYWLDFFQGQSSEAAFLLSRLDTPAARQMLVYHHETPPGTTGVPDPARAAFLADLASLGNWPTGPRLVAAANGSGTMQNQGYAPGAQLIDYVYRSLLVDIDGNVWAVPDGTPSTLILEGLIDIILLPDDVLNVTVSGTLPYDGAPGGSRSSLADMDSTTAPYGDIIALHPDHCFVPTISALAMAGVTDPFFDVAGHPDPLSLTPFDDIYYPAANEEHIAITAASAAWFLGQIRDGIVDAPAPAAAAPAGLTLLPPWPNPSRGDLRIRFSLGEPRRVTVDVLDVAGRRVGRVLDREPLAAGVREVTWSRGSGPAGVYLYRVRADDRTASGKAVLLD